MTKKRGPWTILSKKNVYKNPWLELIEDNVVGKDKKKTIFGYVNLVSGVSVLPVDKNQNVYLVKEFHYAINKQIVGCVSGAMEKNETPLFSAKRELKEELGMKAKKWISLGEVHPFTQHVYSPAHLFLAHDLVEGKQNLDDTEEIEILKMPIKKAAKLAMQSKIVHGPSVALILKAAQYYNLSK